MEAGSIPWRQSAGAGHPPVVLGGRLVEAPCALQRAPPREEKRWAGGLPAYPSSRPSAGSRYPWLDRSKPRTPRPSKGRNESPPRRDSGWEGALRGGARGRLGVVRSLEAASQRRAVA